MLCNSYYYVAFLFSFDTLDIGRGRCGIAEAMARITCPTIVVGISTDIIFTPEEMRQLAEGFPDAVYREIDSAFGHDGFLVEADRLNEILLPFMDGATD